MTTLKEALEVVRNAGYKVTDPRTSESMWDVLPDDNEYAVVMHAVDMYEVDERYTGVDFAGVIEDIEGNSDGTVNLLVAKDG